MHHSFIDRYSNLDTTIHRLDPRLKIAFTFFAIITIVMTKAGNFAPFLCYIAAATALWTLSKLPFRYLLSRLALAVPFIAIMGIGMAPKSPDLFIYMIVRATLALTFLTLLTSTTSFPLLLDGLRWFKLPKVLHQLLSFIYRFIYIIIDEFQRLNRGRRSREFANQIRLSWKGRSWMVGTFLVRSIDRSERVYQAMLARGYTGQN